MGGSASLLGMYGVIYFTGQRIAAVQMAEIAEQEKQAVMQIVCACAVRVVSRVGVQHHSAMSAVSAATPREQRYVCAQAAGMLTSSAAFSSEVRQSSVPYCLLLTGGAALPAGLQADRLSQES